MSRKRSHMALYDYKLVCLFHTSLDSPRDWLTLRHCLLPRPGCHRRQIHSFLAHAYTIVCLSEVEIRNPYPFPPSDCGILSVWAVFLNLERKIGHYHGCLINYCVVLCCAEVL